MLLYTWKDVERKLLLNKEEWKTVITDIEVYSSEIIVYIRDMELKDSAKKILSRILEERYDIEKNKIILDLSGEYLEVIFEVEENEVKESVMSPLFRNILYRQSAYNNDLIEKELPGVPILAFHSYKGGV